MSPAAEYGVTVSYTFDLSLLTPCRANYTFWPDDIHICWVLLGSYSYTEDQGLLFHVNLFFETEALLLLLETLLA